MKKSSTKFVELVSMPKYRFVVQAPSGMVRRGTITESDEQAARKRLREAGFTVVTLAEEADIVVHTPSSGPAAVKMQTKPERAAIIDFEETGFEKFQNFINKYFLRKETALVLGVAGLIWIVYSGLGSKSNAVSTEPQYLPIKVLVVSDVSVVEANTMVVRLPEIPYSKSERLAPDPSGKQSLSFEIEVVKIPTKVEVQLAEGSEVKAVDSGELSVKGGGLYEFIASPSAVPKKI